MKRIERSIYSFLSQQRKRMHGVTFVGIIRANFRDKYTPAEVEDALDRMVKRRKIMTNKKSEDFGGAHYSYWVRTDPNEATPESEKGGYCVPATPQRTLYFLKHYMRTDMVYDVSKHVRSRMEKRPRVSNISHVINGIKDTVDYWKELNLYEIMNKNEYHCNPLFDLEPEEDFEHDIKLMEFHIKELKKIQRGVNSRRAFEEA